MSRGLFRTSAVVRTACSSRETPSHCVLLTGPHTPAAVSVDTDSCFPAALLSGLQISKERSTQQKRQFLNFFHCPGATALSPLRESRPVASQRPSQPTTSAALAPRCRLRPPGAASAAPWQTEVEPSRPPLGCPGFRLPRARCAPACASLSAPLAAPFPAQSNNLSPLSA